MLLPLVITSLDGPRSCTLKVETFLDGDWAGLDSSHLSRSLEVNSRTLYRILSCSSLSDLHRGRTSAHLYSNDSSAMDTGVLSDLTTDKEDASRMEIATFEPEPEKRDVSESGITSNFSRPSWKRRKRPTITNIHTDGFNSALFVMTNNGFSGLSRSSDPHRDSLRNNLLRRATLFRAVEDIPWSAKLLHQLDPRDYEGFILSRQYKQRQTFSRRSRILQRVPLARVTKPIEYFNGRMELLRVFKGYFQTVLSLRDFGFEHRNINLDNLSIELGTGSKGIGFITSYDDKREAARQQRPCFIYTMRCRIPTTEFSEDYKAHDSLESLLICLIWIVTTRSGSHKNVKRASEDLFCFGRSELGAWNERHFCDLNLSENLNLARYKRNIMVSTDKFEKKLLDGVHPHFARFKNLLRVLRALIYDPQWEETRNLLADPNGSDATARRVLVGFFKEVLEDAFDETFQSDGREVLKRALHSPVRTDKNSSIGGSDRSVCIPNEDDVGMDAAAYNKFRRFKWQNLDSEVKKNLALAVQDLSEGFIHI